MRMIFIFIFLSLLSGCSPFENKALEQEQSKKPEDENKTSIHQDFQIQLLRNTVDKKGKWEAFADVKNSAATFLDRVNKLNNAIGTMVMKTESAGLDPNKIAEQDKTITVDTSSESKFLGAIQYRRATVYLFLNKTKVSDNDKVVDEHRLMAFGSTLIKHGGSSGTELSSVTADDVNKFLTQKKIELPPGTKFFLDSEALKKSDKPEEKAETKDVDYSILVMTKAGNWQDFADVKDQVVTFKNHAQNILDKAVCETVAKIEDAGIIETNKIDAKDKNITVDATKKSQLLEVMRYRTGTIYLFLNTTKATDNMGNVVDEYRLMAFGRDIAHSGGQTNLASVSSLTADKIDEFLAKHNINLPNGTKLFLE